MRNAEYRIQDLNFEIRIWDFLRQMQAGVIGDKYGKDKETG